MITVLAQERLLGAALGSAFAGIVVFEHRRNLYKSISENNRPPTSQSRVREPTFSKSFLPEFSHLWNKAVDQTFGPVIRALSSRGW